MIKDDMKAIPFIMALSIVVSTPLFHPGIFSGHDPLIRDFYRLDQFVEGILSGYYHPIWQADFYFGYGYPFFAFYQPLIYYVASIFIGMGLSLMIALKILIFLGIFFSGLAMFITARYFWGVSGAYISSILYMTAPYHLADIYVRTSLAEFWSFVFYPLIVLFGFRIVECEENPIRLSVPISLLIVCHNVMALLFIPIAFFILFSMAVMRKKFNAILTLFTAFLMGGGLSAFFWIPALLEKQSVSIQRMTTGGYNYNIHFLHPYQLISERWGYGASGPGIETFPFNIGWLTVSLVVLAFLTHFKMNDICRTRFRVILVFIIIVLCMILPVSSSIWAHVPLIKMAQFPWRFCTILTFCTALLSGASSFLIDRKNKNTSNLFIVLIILLLGVFYGKNIRGINYFYVSDQTISKEEMTGKCITTTATNEYLPVTSNGILNPSIASRFLWDGKSADIEHISERYADYRCQINSHERGHLIINVLFYPGWRVVVDDVRVPVSPTKPDGLLQVNIEKGSHELRVFFGYTPLRKFAMTISVITGIIWGFVWIRTRKKERFAL